MVTLGRRVDLTCVYYSMLEENFAGYLPLTFV